MLPPCVADSDRRRLLQEWSGAQEPSVGGSESNLEWYNDFEIARVEILAAAGKRASIGQFGVGTPDVTNPALMAKFTPAITTAIAHGGILNVHEYASPTLSCGFDNTTGLGWFTGRYRRWYRNVLLPQNLKIPLVISEAGIDNVGSACGSPNLGGWRNYYKAWNVPDPSAYYTQQLAWYDSVLRADDYVLGVTIFCLDISGWTPYDITPAVPDIIAYMNKQ